MMPGMAANPFIFEYIKLPEDQFQIHWLEWIPPLDKEKLNEYAQRMCQKVTHDNPVLIGVSFGGMLVQEMAHHIKCRKVIAISSIKSYHELPVHLKFLRKTKTYNILPTQLVSNIEVLSKFAFGEMVKKRVELYKKYLSVKDKKYLDWAIREIVCWNQEKPDKQTVFIHGDQDLVFPHSCNADTLVVKGGTHIMIITKYKWFNKHLPELILEDSTQ
jgi:pimeloyl-ACP methyl ester carboxylesterase